MMTDFFISIKVRPPEHSIKQFSCSHSNLLQIFWSVWRSLAAANSPLVLVLFPWVCTCGIWEAVGTRWVGLPSHLTLYGVSLLTFSQGSRTCSSRSVLFAKIQLKDRHDQTLCQWCHDLYTTCKFLHRGCKIPFVPAPVPAVWSCQLPGHHLHHVSALSGWQGGLFSFFLSFFPECSRFAFFFPSERHKLFFTF